MTELLGNAWQGWIQFNSVGKLSAALLISLVLLWVYSKRVPQKTFLVYTSVVTAVCILPAADGCGGDAVSDEILRL